MKRLVLTMIAFLAFTTLMAGQEKQDVTQRQHPVITQQQVEKDEKLALEQRRQLEEERSAQLEKQKREERTQVTSNENNKIAPKKTSTSTGEQ
ncbi:hypothetical protein [uncultured Flavobacterium sp.]|uniref:hypothetical protein n=1 Tax=uncultured Flavobacterium sp. TaxID=165435 RepID=UPI0025E4CE47|nr:hypothetical protein [uncultured Flavobacterium sp.]